MANNVIYLPNEKCASGFLVVTFATQCEQIKKANEKKKDHQPVWVGKKKKKIHVWFTTSIYGSSFMLHFKSH